jgi:hypothetical protein
MSGSWRACCDAWAAAYGAGQLDGVQWRVESSGGGPVSGLGEEGGGCPLVVGDLLWLVFFFPLGLDQTAAFLTGVAVVRSPPTAPLAGRGTGEAPPATIVVPAVASDPDGSADEWCEWGLCVDAATAGATVVDTSGSATLGWTSGGQDSPTPHLHLHLHLHIAVHPTYHVPCLYFRAFTEGTWGGLPHQRDHYDEVPTYLLGGNLNLNVL